MGILTDKVKSAFSMYEAGDFKGFVRALVDVGDVGYKFHRNIVNAEVEAQLKGL